MQEVNAVTLAVETLHPDVGAVIELGGQDAKIIMFKKNEETGDKTAITSMNDKCASGTGATIDKCVLKVGLPREEVVDARASTTRSSTTSPPSAACSPRPTSSTWSRPASRRIEIMNSLADAIVMQNLSVLTRGNTLRHKVLLLGGPNTYLPFLQECWRQRIPETWHERGYEYPKDVPIEELIFVPKNAQYYAAYGAVLYGLLRGRRRRRATAASSALEEFITHGRKARLGETRGPAARRGRRAELDEFREHYTIPKFDAATFEPGKTVHGVIGLDGGSTSSKAVFIDYETANILKKAYQLSKGNPIQDTKEHPRATCKQCVDRPGRDARGHRLRRHRLRRRRARGVASTPTRTSSRPSRT